MKNKFLLIAALVLGSFSMANAQGYVPGFGGKHNCVKTDFNCGWFLNEFSNIDGSGKRGMFGVGGSITYEHVFKPGIGVGVSAIMDNGNIVPLALFKVEFKSAIIPIGVIHHEEGAELVFLGQSEEIVLNNRTNCIDYPMLYS